ncbi:MAG TPA: ATP-binding protein [Methylomirabilota bacterium]|nr:ATP-binding protein [Methylomirabilota bacterium]
MEQAGDLLSDSVRPSLLGSLLTVWVLVVLFTYLNYYTRRRYFTIWTVAWLFYALWLTLTLNKPSSSYSSLWFVLQQLSVATSAVFLFWGSLSCLNLKVRDRLMTLFLVFVILWSYAAHWYVDRMLWVQLPIFALTGLASAFVGCAFLRFRRKGRSVGSGLLFFGFLLWGIFLASFPLAQEHRAFIGTAFLLSSGLQLFIAVSMIVLVLEEVRENTEDMQRQLNSIKAEKHSLQMKFLTADQGSALLAEKELPKDLQQAYVELRRTHHVMVQQERLRALGQMASGIAHDINNALSPILTFTELLLKQETIPQTARKSLQHIRTAGEDIARLAAQMRDFYRRRTSLDELAEVNIEELIGQVVDLTRPRWRDMAQRNGATILVETRVTPNLPPFQSEQTELRETLTNLVLNSVDALPQGGTITISADIQTTGKDRQLLLEVADSGTGMTEEVRKRCLEPFFSTKDYHGGSGLGLAMVYGVMQRHEGKIEIDSEPGQGTRVRLHFPIGVGVRSAAAHRAKAAECPPLRILCIDDEPLLREMLDQLLKGSGHSVSLAATGKQGIDAFNQARADHRPFDVVITDLGMPAMDGREVARKIKVQSPQTPVVLLTGWGTLVGEDATDASAFDAILSKPPRLGELMNALTKASRFLTPGLRPAS